MNRFRIFFYFRLFLFIILFSFISVHTTYATVSVGAPKTIERGTSFTINWTVTNDSGCQGDTDFPAGTVRTSWVTSLGTSGNISGTSATADNPTYTFTCTSYSDSSVGGSATLTVQDCGGSLSSGRTYWNGSACVVPQPSGCTAGTTYWGNCGYYVGAMTNGQSGNTAANFLSGYTGSANFSCSAGVRTISNPTCVPIPPASCGTSDNQSFATQPSSNLCSVGTASAVATLPDCSTAGLGYPGSCTLKKGSMYDCGSWQQSGYCDGDYCDPQGDYCSSDNDCGDTSYSGSCTTNPANGAWKWSCTGSGAPASCSAKLIANSCSGTAPTGSNWTSRGASTASAAWTYAASGNCTWSCNSGYHQSGTSCVANTQPYICAAKPATGTVYNSVSSYTQTWDGSAWSPPADGTTDYNATASATSCRYTCATNYSLVGGVCTANTCSGTAPTGSNWTSRGASTASAAWTYAASGNCTWSCDGGYHQSGTTCVVSTYALTTPTSGGTGSGSYGGTVAGSVNSGTAVSITATPSADSLFTSWTATGAATACNGSTVSPCNFSMTAAASVTANYTLKINGACAAGAGPWGTLPATESSFCSAGGTHDSLGTYSTYWAWRCPGLYGGTDASGCSADKIIVTITATTPYNTTPNASVSFAYTPSTNTGATECRLLDSSHSALTAYQASSPIAYNAPNGLSSYGYYVQCRNTVTTSAIRESSLITVNTSCPSGTTFDLDGARCAAVCNLPWGGTTNSGTSVTAYQSSSVVDPVTCASVAETRSCNNGTLSRSYTNQTCSVTIISGNLTAPASCTIDAGASTCTVVASWNTTNSTAPAIVDVNTGTTLSTTASSGGLTVWVSHPSTVFNLKDTVAPAHLLDTRTVTSTCAPLSTWDGSKCLADVVISGGASAFTVTPSTIYAEYPAGQSSMLNWSGVSGGGTVTCTITNNQDAVSWSAAIPSGSRTTGIRSVNTTFRLTCGNGVGPDVWKVATLTVVSGTLLSSSPTCTIALGASTCPVNITWTTTNQIVTSAVTKDRPAANTSAFTPANNGTNQSTAISGAYPSTIFYLYNSGNLLAAPVTVTPACAGASSWNVLSAKCTLPPTATVTVPPCTIAADASTCLSSVSWVSTDLIVSLSVRQNGTQFSVAPSNGGTNRTLQYGSGPSNTFTAVDNGVTLDTKTGTATCVAESSWSATDGKCLADVAIGTFTLTSSLVYVNGSTNLNWSGVTGGGTVTCSIDNGVGAVLPPAGSKTTGARAVDTTFTITCGNGAGTDATKQVTLGIISGTLNMSADSCVIQEDESLCPVSAVDATWSTTHTTTPTLVDGNLPASTTLSTLASAANFPVNVAYPQTVFFLNNAGVKLDTKTVTATCAVGTGYDPVSNTCVGTPVVTMDPAVQQISYGRPATVGWTSQKTTSCPIHSANWNPSSAISGSAVTDIFTTTPQTVSITCIGPALIPVTGLSNVNVCNAANPVLIGVTCQPAPVGGSSITTGQYTPSGTITVSCSYSDSYTVKLDGSVFSVLSTIPPASFTYFSRIIPVSVAGTYTVTCNSLSSDKVPYTFIDTTQGAKYETKPPAPVVSLKQTPATVSKGTASVISWVVMYPNSVQVPARASCTLTALPVCANSVCTSAQNTAGDAINTIINSGTTDSNDPGNKANGLRLISGNTGALHIIPGYNMSINDGVTDWKAYGQKTFNLSNSMDFELDCGGLGRYEKAKVRVNVTSSNEG